MKTILIIGAFVLCSILAVAVISTFWPRYEERFFELGLLGKDKKAQGYFLNDNSTIEVGSQVLWYIYVHNHVGSAQNVSVRVKLLNSTMEVPNDREHEPSPFASFVEFSLSLSVDDTLFVPFSWGVFEAVTKDEAIILKGLLVNGQTIEVNVPAFSDHIFHMVFELWVCDQSSNEYEFGWKAGEEFSSASLNIGFRVILPAD